MLNGLQVMMDNTSELWLALQEQKQEWEVIEKGCDSLTSKQCRELLSFSAPSLSFSPRQTAKRQIF
jgi:plasmid maintenance system antidote protein VapI